MIKEHVALAVARLDPNLGAGKHGAHDLRGTPRRAMRRVLPRSRTGWTLAAITALAAALRFSTLGLQSYWYNEAATVVLMKMGLGDMLAHVPRMEGNPPLYYAIAWLWAKVFGTGEVGLRALSALIGAVTVPIAYAVTDRLAGRRPALVVGALAACSPLLVWFSQEARPYALLALLTALSLLLFVRLLEERSTRLLVLWTIVSALALATHYFAAFAVGPELIWLLLVLAQRRLVLAGGAVLCGVCAALVPIALEQRNPAKTSIPGSFGGRLLQLPKQLLVGFGLYTPSERIVVLVGAALLALGVWLVFTRGDRRERRGALLAATIGGSGVAAVCLLAAVGLDYLNTRNMIETWLPLAMVAACGLGAMRAGWVGPAGAAALCAISLGAVLAVDVYRPYQRDDWRGAVGALGHARVPRAIVVTPASGSVPLQVYLPRARVVRSPTVMVGEIDIVAMAQRSSPGRAPQPPRGVVLAPTPPGFAVAETTRDRMFTIVRYRAPMPSLVYKGALGGLRLSPVATLVEVEP